ncbi:MAG: SUMF1/EgtB/PvdO family nonheme iron enzyme, partial [Chloroflexota bacterium]|nr:SUMF1/EgtB/PvdO family nonheme iron enzyme [Chloroflexota bacterium]
MTASFTLKIWQARVAAWWRAKSPHWRQQLQRGGVQTTYGLLTASAFLPLLEAYSQQPGPAITTLVGLVGGVGSNLVANVVQGAYDRATASQQIEQEIAENPGLRAEYEALLGKLDVLGAAQAALGAQWAGFEAQLREELARLGGELRVETGGGAVIFGSVKVQYGDFVARDKHVHYHAAPPPPDLTSLREAYLRQVVKRTTHLPLRGLDAGAGDPAKAQRPRLAQVYVGLDTQTRVGGEGMESALPGRIGGYEDRLLPVLGAVAVNRFAVVLGDPGSGKSTFINHLACCLAQQHLDPAGGWLAHLPGWPETEANLLPVVVTLRDFARWARAQNLSAGNAGLLGKFLARWLTDRDLADFADPLREALRDGQAIVFFDGLDEIPTGVQRALVRDTVVDFACTYEQVRIVVTCRTLSYQKKAQQLPADNFSTFELAPFNEEKIDQFIQAWYAELADLGAVRLEEAPALTNKLKNAARRPDIRRMASNPLLLTVMALVHAQGRLPEARALLYEKCTDLLLWRWEEVKVQGEKEGLPGLRRLLQKAKLQDVDFKRVLWSLAFAAHAQGGSDGGDESVTADITETDLLRALRDLHPAKSWDWAAAVVQQIKERAGLLIEREPGVYAFPHRTFQEYLAACHLSAQSNFAKRAVELLEEAAFWREVTLLAVGRQVHISCSLALPLALAAELCPLKCGAEDVVWQRVWRAGEVLQEAGSRRVRQEGVLGQELLERVRNRLAQLLAEGRLTPRERLEAGDVLGRLGDPRPGVSTIPGEGSEIPDILWVKIPAGPFLMGSVDDDTEAYDDEKPQHELTLPTYYIARYPVTNAQFRPFVEGDGYTNPAYWTAPGWAWRQGAAPDLSPWDDYSNENWKRRYREWLAGRPVAKRGRPFWWNDSRWGAPTRPVVGVTWFEAVAYTRWLKKQLQVASLKLQVWTAAGVEIVNLQHSTCNFRLPSEAEWEKAARGTDGQRYPGGDDWQADYGNIIEGTGIEETNAVGCFPRGASPYGVLEMSGNVWEWTRSSWGERSILQAEYGYPYDPNDGRERLEDMKIPILRGGSWNGNRRYARCAYRGRYIP